MWPKMVSTKDLAYLEDMLSWNNTLKSKLIYFVDECFDEDLCPYLEKVINTVDNNIKGLTKVLESGVNYGK